MTKRAIAAPVWAVPLEGFYSCASLFIQCSSAVKELKNTIDNKGLKSVEMPRNWHPACSLQGFRRSGGAYLKLMKISSVLAVGALALISVSGVRGDSLPDGRQGVGTSGPGSPPCSQFSYSADPTGAIPAGTQCTEGANTTTISIFSPGSSPLTVYSPLLESPTVDSGSAVFNAFADGLLATTDLVWTSTCGPTTIGGAAAQECTLTAPKVDTLNDAIVLAIVGSGLNDGDCDSDDTILFVPKGCDVFFTTGAIGSLPGDSTTGGAGGTSNFFAPDEKLQSTSNGAAPVPFAVPEPASLALMFMGFGGLAAMRRRLAN